MPGGPPPGAPPAAPPRPAPPPEQQAQLPPLRMDPKDCRLWWDRVDLAQRRTKEEADKWQILLKGYLPPESNAADAINSNVHFRNTNLKMAETFAQLPEIHLAPQMAMDGIVDPQTGQPIPKEDIIAVKREILNIKLGPDEADAEQMATEVLFDIFQTSGIGASKICYEADQPEIIAQVPTGKMLPPAPGSVLGLGGQIPETKPTPVPGPPVAERWLWYHFSPSKLLIPHDYRSTDYDQASWLGMGFTADLTDATRKKYHLPQDFQGTVSRDDLVLDTTGREPGNGATNLIKGVEIWLYAARFDADVVNAKVMYRLVLIEGMDHDQPAVYERSPYQRILTDGKLSQRSLIGNPIHPFVLRVATDMAWIPADAAHTDPLVKQKNTWRAQSIKARDANLPRFFHSDVITEAVDKLQNADVGQGVAIAPDQMALGAEKLIAAIPHLERAESDLEGERAIDRDIQETLGLGSNQAGGLNPTVRSATEVATVQANVSVRLKGEQNRFLKRFLQGVRKFDTLIMLFLDEPGAVEITGKDGARRLQAYNQAMLTGRYAYAAKIDSQLTNDPDRRKKNATDFTNFMAKSPFMDQEGLARLVTTEFGYDPAHLVRTPPPPSKPEPEKPRVSFAFNGADLAIPEVRAILGMTGIQLAPQPSPEAVLAHQAAQIKALPHGGAADQVEKVSKHHSEETGNMPGAPSLARPQPASPHTSGMVQ